jgi:hypothetical protein
MVQRHLPGMAPELPYPNVEGWPVLNYGHPGRDGYRSGWIHRCYYPTAEAALADAELANRLTGVTLYVITMEVDKNFRRYWPHKTNWRISLDPPFHGQAGAYYHRRPDYYVVDNKALMACVFIAGEK